jgi:hypothetical protein
MDHTKLPLTHLVQKYKSDVIVNLIKFFSLSLSFPSFLSFLYFFCLSLPLPFLLPFSPLATDHPPHFIALSPYSIMSPFLFFPLFTETLNPRLLFPRTEHLSQPHTEQIPLTQQLSAPFTSPFLFPLSDWAIGSSPLRLKSRVDPLSLSLAPPRQIRQEHDWGPLSASRKPRLAAARGDAPSAFLGPEPTTHSFLSQDLAPCPTTPSAPSLDQSRARSTHHHGRRWACLHLTPVPAEPTSTTPQLALEPFTFLVISVPLIPGRVGCGAGLSLCLEIRWVLPLLALCCCCLVLLKPPVLCDLVGVLLVTVLYQYPYPTSWFPFRCWFVFIRDQSSDVGPLCGPGLSLVLLVLLFFCRCAWVGSRLSRAASVTCLVHWFIVCLGTLVPVGTSEAEP